MRSHKLLALLSLLLALVSPHEMLIHGVKTIYERGDSAWPFDSIMDFRMAEGQCTGVMEGFNLPCHSWPLFPPKRLRVTVEYDLVPPEVVISDQLDYANVTRKEPCHRNLQVRLEGGCHGYLR